MFFFNRISLFLDKLLFFLLPVQYAVHLYQYLKEWRKNPHWSFSCCLALILPLSEMQGEITGLVGTNQNQAGSVEMPSFTSTIKKRRNTGGTDAEGGHGGQVKMKERRSICENTEYNSQKYHQGTQTQLFMHSVTGIRIRLVTELMHGRAEKPL